jgi:hypothetical protein
VRVHIVRAGGFAGVEQDVGVLDTARLPAEAAQEVEAAVTQVAATPPEVGADLLQYRVTVADEAGERTYAVPDPASGEAPSPETAAAGSALAVLLRHCGPP